MTVILSFACIFGLGVQYAFSFEIIRISEIEILNLLKDFDTVGYNPKPQLKCEGDKIICDQYAPSLVACKNIGLNSVKWECEAQPRFQDDVMFEKLDVNCEKVMHAVYDDKVIEGSCGLTYSLKKAYKTARLTDIKSLHLLKGRYTLGSKPIPQLRCHGDLGLCRSYSLDTVTCYNLGYVKSRISWKCQAALSNNCEFYSLNVSCEKAESKINDDSVIEGSCGLRYSIKRNSDYRSAVVVILIIFVIIGTCVAIVYFCMKNDEHNSGERSTAPYTDHTPVKTTNVYTVPVRPSYYLPSYSQTNVGFGSAPYRDDSKRNDSQVGAGYAHTFYGNDDYLSGNVAHVDTGYAKTSSGNDDYSGRNDYSIDKGFSDVSFS